MKKIVFFDIDGTLVTYQNKLPRSTIEGIQVLKEKGHIPVISTGRPAKMLAPIAEALQIESYIALNGQYVVVNGEKIHSNTLPTDIVESLIRASYENDDRTFLLTEEKIIGNTFMEEMMDPEFMTFVLTHFKDESPEVMGVLFKHMTEKPLKKETYENEEILTAFINSSESSDDYYRRKFPDLHITRATPIMGEVLMKGSHKATGMELIANHLKIPMKDTIAFGDSLNDLEIVETAGIGVAMGNGRKELKMVADYVTTDVADDGIYRGLKHVGVI